MSQPPPPSTDPHRHGPPRGTPLERAAGSPRFGIPPRPDLVRPLATWRWWEALAVYIGAIVLSSPLIALFDTNGFGTLLASITVALLTLVILLAWLRLLHPGWVAVVGLPPRDRVLGEIGVGGLSGVAALGLAAFLVARILSLILGAVSGERVDAPQQIPSNLDALGVSLAVTYAAVIAPIAEEIFFRGVLFRSLRDRYGFWIGAVGSGAAFGLAHYVPGPAIEAFLLMGTMVITGIAFAAIYEWRHNIVAAIAGHMAFNGVALMLIFAVE